MLAGAQVDFRHADGAPRAFRRCFLRELRRELDPEALRWLGAVRHDEGEPAAARALNVLAAPVADPCGERWLVPQLIEAADGLGVR